MNSQGFAERDRASARQVDSGFAAIAPAVRDTGWLLWPCPSSTTEYDETSAEFRSATAAVKDGVTPNAEQIERWAVMWPSAGAVIHIPEDTKTPEAAKIIAVTVSIETGDMMDRDDALAEAALQLVRDAIGYAPRLEYETAYAGAAERVRHISYYVACEHYVGGRTFAAAECRTLHAGVKVWADVAEPVRSRVTWHLRAEGDLSRIPAVDVGVLQALVAALEELRHEYDYRVEPNIHRPRAFDAVAPMTLDLSPAACEARDAIYARRKRMTSQPGPRGGWDPHYERWDSLYYLQVGEPLFDSGFCDFPQKTESKNRGPANGSGFEPSKHYDRSTLKRSDVERWCYGTLRRRDAHGNCWYDNSVGVSNTAIVCGPASGNLICIDIDVTDLAASIELQRKAEMHCGATKFVRVGNAPKAMLVYRLAEPHLETIKTITFAGPSRDQVEFLGYKKQFTAYGLHHKTELAFLWERHILGSKVEDIPVTTLDQVLAFSADVEDNFEILVEERNQHSISSIYVPQSAGSKIGVVLSTDVEWTVDPSSSLIVDGREKFLKKICWELVRANPSRNYSPEDIAELHALAFQAFAEKADRSGWGDGRVNQKIAEKLKANTFLMMDGGMTPNFNIRRGIDGSATYETPLPAAAASAFARMANTGLEWLTAGKAFAPTHGRLKSSTATPDELLACREKRALLPWRGDMTADVARKCDKTADALWRSVVEGKDAKLIRALMAPTGSGKTSRVFARLIQRIRERPDTLKGRRIIFNVPRYENALELLDKARDELDCEVLTHESEIPVGPADSRRPRVALWVGKKHTSCPNRDQMDEMEKADIAPGRVCSAGKIKCKIWEAGLCQYHRQKDIYATATIVICVVSYLTMHNVPDALSKGAAALVVDEDPILNITREFKLELEHLTADRPGTMTPKLISANYTDPMTVEQDRKNAVNVCLAAIKAGKDPAAAMLDYQTTHNGQTTTGWDLLLCAKAVIEQVRAAELKIEPNMSSEAIARVLADQGPKWGGITAERHFWRVIADRMEALKEDRLNHDLWETAVRSAWAQVSDNVPNDVRAAAVKKAERLEKNPPRTKARGTTDARLQLRGHVDAEGKTVYTHIRVSRRIETKFQDIPALLLDASAQIPLVEKVFGRRVEAIPVYAPPHLRVAVCLDEVFSDASICPDADDDFEASAKKEARVRKIRLMISKTCDHYAPVRVLLVASQKVLEVLLYAWKVPGNLDWMYYGNLRGLDGAKHHGAIITVGRSQMPPEVVDAKAAAITYDDDEPEAPFDLLGNGHTADGKGIRRPSTARTLQMRNGHNIVRQVPTMPTARGVQIETAWREEELRQAVGRLRVVHRGGDTEPPLWIALGGSAIPSDFVVDEIFSLDDGIADAGEADKRRRAGEIVSDKKALKLAEKRASTDDEHAEREIEIEKTRAANETIPFVEIRHIVETAELLAWRLEFWSLLSGLPAAWRALVATPERLFEIGLDPDTVDDLSYQEAKRLQAEQTAGEEVVETTEAPSMTTPIEPVSEVSRVFDAAIVDVWRRDFELYDEPEPEWAG